MLYKRLAMRACILQLYRVLSVSLIVCLPCRDYCTFLHCILSPPLLSLFRVSFLYCFLFFLHIMSLFIYFDVFSSQLQSFTLPDAAPLAETSYAHRMRVKGIRPLSRQLHR